MLSKLTLLLGFLNSWMPLLQVIIHTFLDTHVSLAPTHVCLSVRPSVRPSVGDTFEFPLPLAEHFCATVVFDVI